MYCYVDAFNDDRVYTLIQRRTSDAVQFDKNWVQYRQGFGDIKNYWMGLDWMYGLMAKQNYLKCKKLNFVRQITFF